MPDRPQVLVTGATGNQGGAVARALLARGHQVRCLTRRPDSDAARDLEARGAEVVSGDFDDPASLAAVFESVEVAFVMATPFEAGPEAEVRHGTHLLEAAKRAGAGHVVYSSVASADRRTGVPHFESKAQLEERLIGLDIPYTIIAPVFFMENLLAPWVLPGLQNGVLTLPLPSDRVLQQIAVADIGSFVAHVIEDRARFVGARLEIASDELSGEDAAAMLSEATGREVRFLEFPLEQMRAMSADAATMFEWLGRTGYSVDWLRLSGDHADIGWTSFEDWAHAQPWAQLLPADP